MPEKLSDLGFKIHHVPIHISCVHTSDGGAVASTGIVLDDIAIFFPIFISLFTEI